MTWPTEQAREACFGTCGGDRRQHAPHEDMGCAMFEDTLDALAPHVAALVRAERAAALREAANLIGGHDGPRHGVRMADETEWAQWLHARADAERADR